MQAIVNEQGQVQIPENLRRRLGIGQGSRHCFALVGDRLEMRVERAEDAVPASGFGMLKSKRCAVPADLDPASLIQP